MSVITMPLLPRLLLAGFLGILGLSIGISLPQFLPRQQIGESSVVPYSIIHLITMALSIGLPYSFSLIKAWPMNHRIAAALIAAFVVYLFWYDLDWRYGTANSWSRAW